MFILTRFSKGKTVGDIAEVKKGKVEVRESELYVDDIYISNFLGRKMLAKCIRKRE
jgi:hypothetical protein